LPLELFPIFVILHAMTDSQNPRIIFHVDMDAFFASIEQRDDPSLRGRPVIVGADPKNGRGRGVVSAASYEARRYGVHSAQPISQAFRLCPKGAFVHPRFDRYMEVSDRIMALLETYSPRIEPVSLDEAFLDMTGSVRLFGDVDEIGGRMKRQIWDSEGLTASAGVGPNKLIAKIASDLRKPDGFVRVSSDRVREFLDPLPVTKLWGVGAKTASRLESLGIRKVMDVRRYTEKDLIRFFGTFGKWLLDSSQGIDDDPVTPDREAKSVSNETTFEEDTADPGLVRAVVLELSERVGHRLRLKGLCGKAVELKIRFDDFTTKTRRRTLAQATDLTESFFAAALSMLKAFDADKRRIRLLGVGVSQFCPSDQVQMELFGSEERVKRKKMHEAVDRLKEKYGERIVTKALNR
jgi:DNA polymerase-4